MRSVSLRQVTQATEGTLEGSGRLTVTGVSTDSRTIHEKELFFALRGEKYDGHKFLGQVAGAGARAAVVESGNRHLKTFRERKPRFPVVIVPDTLIALGDFASYIRDNLDVIAIGITGSTGKTSTKDLLAAALRTRWGVAASLESFNNEVGVPLTIFEADRKQRFLVAEMAARKTGDIRRLAEIVKPGSGIITNVGVTHLEHFGAAGDVVKAKAELAQALPDTGTLFLNADDRPSTSIARKTAAKVVRFGYSRRADYRATEVEVDGSGHPSFTLSSSEFTVRLRLSLVGRHQVENAAAAAACAAELGLKPADIEKGIASATMSGWRMDTVEAPGGYTVINDAYNASPRSMDAAIEALESVGRDRRTVAVLGMMDELGTASEEFHYGVGRRIANSEVDILVTVGRQAREYARAALDGGLPRGSVFRCEKGAEASEVLEAIIEPTDVVLVKASRVAGLEKVAADLLKTDFLERKAGANA